MDKKLAEYAGLASYVRRLNDSYHNGEASVPDSVFDTLMNTLKRIEADIEPEQRLPWSPTSTVGAPVHMGAVEHAFRMLSLEKVQTYQELEDWAKNAPTCILGASSGKASAEEVASANKSCNIFTVEPKLDGVSLSLEYRYGILHRALTRGDGSLGRDVTCKILRTELAPCFVQEFEDDSLLVLRGEVMLKAEEFYKLNSEADKTYKTERNAVSAHLNGEADLPANFDFIVHGVNGVGVPYVADFLDALEDEGFNVVQAWNVVEPKASDFERLAKLMQKYAQKQSYKIDGIVVKTHHDAQHEADCTATAPRWAIAWKFEQPKAVTVVTGVYWSLSKQGRATPVVKVTPVELNGKTIHKFSATSYKNLAELNLSMGDLVEVAFVGDATAQMVRVVERRGRFSPLHEPAKCPHCGETFVLDGSHAFCTSNKCKKTLAQELVNWFGRKGLGLGMTQALAERLVYGDFVTNRFDFFYLDYVFLSFHRYIGMKEAKAKNFVDLYSGLFGGLTLAQVLELSNIKNLTPALVKELTRNFSTMNECLEVLELRPDLYPLEGKREFLEWAFDLFVVGNLTNLSEGLLELNHGKQ